MSSNWVVARQLVERAFESNLLVGRRDLDWLTARTPGAVGSNVQAAAGVIDAIRTSAGLDGTVKLALVRPAVEVITVQAVPGGIAHGPDPTVEVFYGASVVEEFEKHGEDGNGVGLGAHAGVVVANRREGHLKIASELVSCFILYHTQID